jgi:myosin I
LQVLLLLFNEYFSHYSLELCSQQICVRNPQNQSVVISGESGSGKTEAAKMVLNHIVNRGNTNSLEVLADESVSSLEERLMKSSPLLEAFGNAKSKFVISPPPFIDKFHS